MLTMTLGKLMRLNYDYYNAEELLRIIYDDLDTGETDKKKCG